MIQVRPADAIAIPADQYQQDRARLIQVVGAFAERLQLLEQDRDLSNQQSELQAEQLQQLSQRVETLVQENGSLRDEVKKQVQETAKAKLTASIQKLEKRVKKIEEAIYKWHSIRPIDGGLGGMIAGTFLGPVGVIGGIAAGYFGAEELGKRKIKALEPKLEALKKRLASKRKELEAL